MNVVLLLIRILLKIRPIVFPDWLIGGPETIEYITNSSWKECLVITGVRLDTINLEKSVVVHPKAVVNDNTHDQVQRIRRPGRLNCSPYSTNFGSSSVNVEQRNHWVLAVLSIAERHIYVYDLYRATCHDSYVRDEIQKLDQLLAMYVSMEFANNSDDTQDQHIAYDVMYVEDIPQQESYGL
ncbi:hypothetical protein RDI58_010863 [Solanum bulbocastanum]|uniref:Ubiquitin-like protease family profile domain-containing protein n=1 Tax=Solanum bulbocastanum TaxID=147425 RepID=A0AAN8TVA7_SOLBU